MTAQARGPQYECVEKEAHQRDALAATPVALESYPRTTRNFFLVQAMVSWQSPLTRWYSRKLSESRVRAVLCYGCPTEQ